MNDERIYNCIVIGAGASGLFFAANTRVSSIREGDCFDASSVDYGYGSPSLILEKTARPGSKLLMSGGGRCNITHSGSIKDFITRYGEHGKNIRRILYKHNNLELINWLRDGGINLTTEEDGRVFPSSMKAQDILDFLLKQSRENGFEIRTNSPVTAIERCGEFWRVHISGADGGKVTAAGKQKSFLGKHIIIATGGCSYPRTGSDGSMFNVLRRDLITEITDLAPALSPISVDDYPYADLSGVSIDGSVSKIADRKTQSIGNILFTHNGLSGPAIINISGSLSTGDKIKINYLYPMSYDAVFRTLQEAMLGNKSQLANVVSQTFDLPKNFCRVLAERAGSSTKAFARLLAEDELIVKSSGSFDSAMVTRGGVSLDEVDLSTMELIKCPGIFVIGEALDIDGETGGYNLQFAYSSALAVTFP